MKTINFTFTKLGRALLLSAVMAVCLVGCGGSSSSSLNDSRDGQKYRTVKIGNQVWMAENLRFKIGDSWCYENSEDNCKKYGRLYDWNMAKIACPKGWHLPSDDEWEELITVVGSSEAGKKLKSKNGWNGNAEGTNVFGFSSLPGGYRTSKGAFDKIGFGGLWWTASDDDSYYSYGIECRIMESNYNGVKSLKFNESSGASVRCVAD
ncbi:MAG: fibrobacter succinogenes major paralogous domain-containing protein [Chitinispirillales bacterium]|jgi:uncharacterized protein (TIGR02145 family)|nr:fibrobacter succinogenes major paralogous domain-containing protein [Chitinispirillales bacterium]